VDGCAAVFFKAENEPPQFVRAVFHRDGWLVQQTDEIAMLMQNKQQIT
jgi:hypothetical protein